MLGKPVELVLAATDVIHSLYVPEFRLKQDAVPGRFTKMVFTPTLAGTYPILCTEYCGTNHSTMTSVVVVHPDQASFDAWAVEGKGADETLVEVGVRVFGEKGCSACHSVDGSAGVGPSVKGIWGKEEKLADGATVRVDENYIRESIAEAGRQDQCRLRRHDAPDPARRPGDPGHRRLHPEPEGRTMTSGETYLTHGNGHPLLAPHRGPQAHRHHVPGAHRLLALPGRGLRDGGPLPPLEPGRRAGLERHLQQDVHAARRGDDLPLRHPRHPLGAGQLRRARSWSGPRTWPSRG